MFMNFSSPDGQRSFIATRRDLWLVAGLFVVIGVVVLVIWITGKPSSNDEAPEPVSANPVLPETVCVHSSRGRTWGEELRPIKPGSVGFREENRDA